MIKKFLALTLAGALALPFISGGHAEAATKPEAKPVAVAFNGLLDPWKLKDSQSPDVKAALDRLGVNLDLSQLQKSIAQSVPGQSNGKQAPAQPSPCKPGQSQKPAQQAQPKKPAANNNSDSAAKPSSNSQMSAFEKKVVDLTNQERTKAGLKPLKSDNATLSKMARDKSTDMRDKNYFDHQSPTYGSPFDMMKKYGISFKAAGENIAAGQKTPEEVVQGWMNSPGHRANILNASFTTIGVGYVSGGSYGSYWTQEFIGN